jgi:hypothetical protein
LVEAEIHRPHAEAEPVEGSRGLRVATPRHVLQYKLALGREKERADIELLRQALGPGLT